MVGCHEEVLGRVVLWAHWWMDHLEPLGIKSQDHEDRAALVGSAEIGAQGRAHHHEHDGSKNRSSRSRGCARCA